MRKNTETQIDDHKYTIGHWNVDKQLEILKQLIGLIGESAVRMLLAGEDDEQSRKEKIESFMDKPMDSEVAGAAFRSLIMRLDQTDVKKLFRDIVTDQVHCDGKPFDYNTHFSGRVGHLMKVSVAVLRHQYADFLDVLPGLSAQVREKTTSQVS